VYLFRLCSQTSGHFLRHAVGCHLATVRGSKRVRRWIGEHNLQVRREGGCKIRVCGLPVKVPWLNPIEPKWLHGKRAVVEPTCKLTAAEVKQRVHEHERCEPQD
jgi:hypothetical protein